MKMERRNCQLFREQGKLIFLAATLLSFNLFVIACGESSPVLNPTSSGPNKFKPVNPALSDPYAALTPQELAEKWLAAYIAGDYATDLALLAPETRASFTGSPDAFALKAALVNKEQGPIQKWSVDKVVDRGDEFGVDLTVLRQSCPNLYVCGKQFLTLRRSNSSWKVFTFTFF